MFRPENDFPDVYLCLDPQDFRKGILGLSLVVGIGRYLLPLYLHSRHPWRLALKQIRTLST